MLNEQDIENVVQNEEYLRMGLKTTICLLTLKNGFEVIGTSACVDPASYNYDTGKVWARKRAIEKIWELEGYLAQCG